MKFKYKTALAVMVLCASVAAIASSPAPVNSFASVFPPATNLSNLAIGESTAISPSGQTILVGMGGGGSSPPATVNVGAVLVFTFSRFTWDFEELIDPNGVSNSDFGAAVAVTADGKTFLVGAPGDDKAYIFTQSNGIMSLSHTFVDDILGNGGYGTAVALSSDGTVAVVGDHAHPSGPSGGTANKGAVFVYRLSGGVWDTGTEVDEPPPVSGSDDFGYSVALSPDASLLVVGAPQVDTFGPGDAYVFTASGSAWAPAQSFNDPKRTIHDEFGTSVALSGDGSTVLVGSMGASTSLGAVYLYKDNGASWGSPQEFDDPDGVHSESFSSSIAVSDDGTTWAASAPAAGNGGKAFLYRFTNGAWRTPQEYDDPAGNAGDAYGPLALSGDAATLVVGAKGTPSGSDTNAGNAYQYSPGISLAVAASTLNSTAAAGGSITYDLKVTNNSAVSIAPTLTLTAALPVGLSFVSSNPAGCTASGSKVSCSFANLDLIPGASENISFVGQIDSTASGTLTTTFSAGSSGQYSVAAMAPTAAVSSQVTGSTGGGGTGGGSGGKSGGGTLGWLSLLMLLGMGIFKKSRR